jgi:D-sedoheptulose 7-phosphate isomerase
MEPDHLSPTLEEFRSLLEEVRSRGGKVMLAGNGASASMASHFAVDFTKQAGIRTISFNDSAMITAYGNDYGYEKWVAKAIEHHADRGDLVILISSSGTSPNVVQAARTALEHGCRLVTLTGFDADNPLRTLGEVNLWVESRSYNIVESVHSMWLGLACDLVIGESEYSVDG